MNPAENSTIRELEDSGYRHFKFCTGTTFLPPPPHVTVRGKMRVHDYGELRVWLWDDVDVFCGATISVGGVGTRRRHITVYEGPLDLDQLDAELAVIRGLALIGQWIP